MFIKLHPNDNVAVSLGGEASGGALDGCVAREAIPAGHKMALQDLLAGQAVVKYGYPIGVAKTNIAAGQHVHSHNLHTDLNREQANGTFQGLQVDKDSAGTENQRTSLGRKKEKPLFQFSGWRRSDGRVAIRNEIWILNTVACVNQTANQLAAWANRVLVGKVPHLDGVYTFNHPYGCSQLGEDLEHTRSILTALARHPHAAGVLVLGLGCENNQLQAQLDQIGPEYAEKIRAFSSQSVGDELELGQKYLEELATQLAQQPPELIDSDQLVLGMKCGGSDGLSGITGNPLLGRLADRHANSGGTVLLTEVPEMFGAESALFQRAVDEPTFQAAHEMVAKFKDYFRSHNQPVSENPSPGNKDGGITTLEEKSLGCVQKGGNAPICSVVDYAQQAAPALSGIALVNGPGNDGVSITALTAAGANVILFTTGRGTPMGAPVPTVKVATNSRLSEYKPGWIDFNAGTIAEGATLEDTADQLVGWLKGLANHELEAKNERNGYREIAIWKSGVTL